MGIETYNQAVELIKNNADLADFDGECSEEIIRLAEEKLNLSFPATYRKFLKDYSVGNFASFEIYGIVKDRLDVFGVPNMVGITLKERQEIQLPSHLIVIGSVGNGQEYYLDCRLSKEASPVLVNWSVFPFNEQAGEIEAEDFSDYFLSHVKRVTESS